MEIVQSIGCNIRAMDANQTIFFSLQRVRTGDKKPGEARRS